MATHQEFKLAARVMVDGRVPGRVVASTPRSVTVATHLGTDVFMGRAVKRLTRIPKHSR